MTVPNPATQKRLERACAALEWAPLADDLHGYLGPRSIDAVAEALAVKFEELGYEIVIRPR